MKRVKLIIQIALLLHFPFLLQAQDWFIKEAPLMTEWVDDLDVKHPLPEYPRPQMVRNEWVNLNGLWEFQQGQAGDELPTGQTLARKILVPFPVESALSGVMEHHERLWYRRTFTVPDSWNGKQILFHMGAVDWESELYINGKSLGIHLGGYDEITRDITPYLHPTGEQEVIVRVYDPTENYGQPRGKQEKPPHNLLIMYTPVTGIWQTVWMEPVSECSIKNLKLIPDLDGEQLKVTVHIDGKAANTQVTLTAKDGKRTVGKISGKPNTELLLPVKNPKKWSPDSPFLYDLVVELKSGDTTLDQLSSYFGMRKISLEQVGKHRKIFLNNEFVYNLGFLDQGYWPDGIYTAPTDEALKYDIQVQKDFGYNMLRKHLKVEPARWYYWADKLGILVWQDMPSANSYKHDPPPVDTQQFAKELEQMIEGRFNSPSIVSWVIFNETQGQKAADGTNLTRQMVDLVQKKDPTRLINAASDNIYKDYLGDILDYHSYPAPKAIESSTMATACGEFGSVGLAVKNHEWLPDSGVSGIMAETKEQLEKIYENYLLQLAEYKTTHGMSGAVFTQLTDVEQEINGFLTYDRIAKVNIEKIRKLNIQLIRHAIDRQVELIPNADSDAQTWRYSITKPVSDWTQPGFDDSGWKNGKAGFGTSNSDGTATNTPWTTNDIWLRKTFELNHSPKKPEDKIVFRVFHDEDVEIYINGVLAASSNGFTTSYVIIPITDEGRQALKLTGKNTLAVHCHQSGGGQFIDVGLVEIQFKLDAD